MDVPPIRVAGTITIEGKVAKCARTSELLGAGPSPPVDKGKRVVENLSSALNNELLNATEVTAESMLAFVAEILCGRMFEGGPRCF